MSDYLNKQSSRGYKGQKYTGVYRAIVTNNADPQNMGRIKIIAPKVTKNSTELSWALPCFDSYQAKCPDINSPVWIMFEDGDISKPVWLGNWLTQGALSSSFLSEEEDVIYSRNGNVFKVASGTGVIYVFNKSGKLIFLGENDIHITDGEGNIVSINTLTETVEIAQKSGNKITLNKTTITIENVDTVTSNINIIADANVGTIGLTAKNVNITADNISM